MPDLSALRPLAIIVADAEPARLWTILSLAASAAALGRPVALFFSGTAASACAQGYVSRDQGDFGAAGVASLGDLFNSCLEQGVSMSVCQTGMDLCNLISADLVPAVTPGGLLGFLQANATAELLMA